MRRGHPDRSTRLVASASQAPSRTCPSASTAGYHTVKPCSAAVAAASASTWTAARTAAVTGNPNENPTPAARHAWAKPWVAPAESDRISTRGPIGSPDLGRYCAGNEDNASPSTWMWSAVVLLPAFPARSIPARASPPAMSGRSRNTSNGWNPYVRFQVAAEFCLASEWSMVIVASTSITNSPAAGGAAPAAHAVALALARAVLRPARCSASTRPSMSRHAVLTDATAPCWAR